jgi:D-sedoheptulose 7-phosphate isomerase
MNESCVVVLEEEKKNPSKLLRSIDASIFAIMQLKKMENLYFVEQVSRLLLDTFRRGGRVLIAGNGGSLCDASHFAEELTGFFYSKKRKAFSAIVLSEPGHLTCCANDIGYDYVFSRGVEAHGRPGDVFIGLSTSGNSQNIIHAFHAAAALDLTCVSFLGKDGGKLKGVADYEMIISGFETSDKVQEAHMAAMHIIIGMMEEKLLSYTSGKL